MASFTLLKTIQLRPELNVIELYFEENINGKILLESEAYKDDLLPMTMKIVLNPEGELKGGFITLPKRKVISNEGLGYFKKIIQAQGLNFLRLKVEEKKTNYNMQINLYQEH